MKYRPIRSIQQLCTLLIFSLFALSSLLLILTGANTFHKVSVHIADNDQARASLSYVANKIRSGDQAGAINLEQPAGTPALVISSSYDGELYKTYLYWHNGSLMEQFLAGADDFIPQHGERIISLRQFTVTQRGSLLVIAAQTESGRNTSISVRLHSATAQ